jgi:hypothetical protein
MTASGIPEFLQHRFRRSSGYSYRHSYLPRPRCSVLKPPKNGVGGGSPCSQSPRRRNPTPLRTVAHCLAFPKGRSGSYSACSLQKCPRTTFDGRLARSHPEIHRPHLVSNCATWTELPSFGQIAVRPISWLALLGGFDPGFGYFRGWPGPIFQ